MENKVVEVLTDEKNKDDVTLTPVENAPGKDALPVVGTDDVDGDTLLQIVKTGKGILQLYRPMPDGTESIYFDLMSVSHMKYMNIVTKVERMKKEKIADPKSDMEVQLEYFSEASSTPIADLRSGLSAKDGERVGTLVFYFLRA